jgi:hypothetical protein
LYKWWRRRMQTLLFCCWSFIIWSIFRRPWSDLGIAQLLRLLIRLKILLLLTLGDFERRTIQLIKGAAHVHLTLRVFIFFFWVLNFESVQLMSRNWLLLRIHYNSDWYIIKYYWKRI